MIAKVLSQLLFASSIVNFFPIDGQILEWRAAAITPQASLSLTYDQGMALPVAKDKLIKVPKKLDLQSFGVVTAGQSILVLDQASGAPLFFKNPDQVRPIGSISKLLAALVFLETEPELSQSVTVTPTDFAGTGRVYLHYHDSVSLTAVLGTSLVGSDNTATLALVRLSGLTLDEFVVRMNAKALDLGMVNSHFEDPSGLSANNVATARELSLLLAEAKRHPAISQYMTQASLSVQQASGRLVTVPSTNLLLTSSLNTGDYAVTAGKTGYLPQAGYCLATVVEFEGHEVTIIVLGAPDGEARFTDVIHLASWTFQTFAWPTL